MFSPAVKIPKFLAAMDTALQGLPTRTISPVLVMLPMRVPSATVQIPVRAVVPNHLFCGKRREVGSRRKKIDGHALELVR